MKNTIYLLFIICSIQLYAQNPKAYSLLQPGASLSEHELVESDLITGQYTTLHTLSEVFPGYPMARAIINPNDSTYNILAYGQVGQDTAMTMEHAFIYSIHIPSGQINRTPISKDALFMEYSCLKNMFYILTYTPSPDTVKLYSYNPISNDLNFVQAYPGIAFYNETNLQSSAFNPNDSHLYFQGVLNSGNPTQKSIFTIDVNSGNIVNTFNIPAGANEDYHQMSFSYQDSSLYTLRVNYNPNERSLVKIDPQTWTANSVSGITENFWYTPRNPSLILPSSNKYYIIGDQNSGSSIGQFHSFDIASGAHDQSGPFYLNTNMKAHFMAKTCPKKESLSLIKMEDEKVKISVYPNPTSGFVTITSSDPFNTIEVINVMGQIVYSTHLNATNEYKIELPKENGVYLIRVSNNAITELFKIIKK